MTLQDELYEKYKIPSDRLKDGQQKTKCPDCQPEHNPSDNPLSITVEPHQIMFKCHHCGMEGAVFEKDTKARKRMPSKKPVPEPIAYLSKPNAFLDRYFEGRGISRQTYEAFNIYTDDNIWIGFPYNGHGGKCDNIKLRTLDKQFRQTPNAKKSLYNYDRVKDAKLVVIVEGEMDALAVYEAGIPEVTTLPDGAPANVAYKENDKRFSCLQTHPLAADKIVLFCDADGAGANLRKELVHRYGKQKCWYVKPPEDCKDANDVLIKHGAGKLKELLDGAIPYPVEGLYTASRYASDVMDLYHGRYDRPVSIGFPSLDEIYKIMKGTFHVWTGIPNHGKSTFLDQCLIQLAKNQNWKFAIFSPEHSSKMHIRRLASMYVGKPFEQGFNGRMTEDELKGAVNWIHKHFYFIETREHTPSIQKILEITKGAIQKFGCNALVIDPYNEVDASRSGKYREDEHVRDFISLNKRFAKMYDITVFVVAHPTKMSKGDGGQYAPPTAYDISGAAHWYNQSDAVITVHRDFDNDSIEVITRKIREQGLYGKIGSARFIFDHASRSFKEPPKPRLSGWDNVQA
jgi:twinkle protein